MDVLCTFIASGGHLLRENGVSDEQSSSGIRRPASRSPALLQEGAFVPERPSLARPSQHRYLVLQVTDNASTFHREPSERTESLSLLMFAAGCGNLRAVELLLEKGGGFFLHSLIVIMVTRPGRRKIHQTLGLE